MPLSFTEKKRIRYSFGKIGKTIDVPNLVDIQKISYDKFLQLGKSVEERSNTGLQEVFNSVFPIKYYAGKSELHYIDYYLDNPKYDVDECRRKGLTFSASLMVTFRLIIWDINEETGEKSLRDIKEQVVYLGDLPLMTNNGTFVVNGTERVVVSQLHRSPGVFFDHDDGKTHASGKVLYNARIIPYRGSWLDFEFDHKDNLFFRIDRKKKMISTTILQALPSRASEKYLEECQHNKVEPDIYKVSGMTSEEMLTYFYETFSFKKQKDGWVVSLDLNKFKYKNLPFNLVDPVSKDVVAYKDVKLSLKLLKEIQDKKINKFFFNEEDLYGFYLSNDIVNYDNGLVYAEAGTLLGAEFFERLNEITKSMWNNYGRVFAEYMFIKDFNEGKLKNISNIIRQPNRNLAIESENADMRKRNEIIILDEIYYETIKNYNKKGLHGFFAYCIAFFKAIKSFSYPKLKIEWHSTNFHGIKNPEKNLGKINTPLDY